MVLRPEGPGGSLKAGFVSAWEAVANAQKKSSARYYLVRQPDHARLAGQIAERFSSPGAPVIDDDIVRGVSLHDEGWDGFDSGRKQLRATPAHYSDVNIPVDGEGKPLSFLDIKAGDFLQAWRGSIASAEAVAPVAALIVSAHFRRIGEFGVSTGTYSEHDTQQVREFIAQEEQRRRRLLRVQHRSEKEVDYWTDVLQFCDLLSLYLCCGSEEDVEFPQPIGPEGETIRLQAKDGVSTLSPTPFAGERHFSLEAQTYPAEAAKKAPTLGWRLR